MSDSLQLSSPAATFDNAESRAAVAVLTYSCRPPSRRHWATSTKRDKRTASTIRTRSRDRLDWRMASFDPASFEQCVQDLSAVDTMNRSTEGSDVTSPTMKTTFKARSHAVVRLSQLGLHNLPPGTVFGCTPLTEPPTTAST